MKTQIEVTFMVDVEESVTEPQIKEWLEFELGARGGMDRNNPADGDIEANSVQFRVL
jgi:hypothetical protein